MKKYFLLPLSVLIFACGGEEAPADEAEEIPGDPDAEVIVNDEPLQNGDYTELMDGEQVAIEYQPENEDGKWQIDDYAEVFMGEEIYPSWDDIPEDKDFGYIYEVLDVKGGYAHVTGAYEGWSEFVLWRMDDGYDLIGTMHAGCGPVCDYRYEFFKCKGQEITKISMARLFPMAKMDDHAEEMRKKVVADQEYIDYPEDKVYLFRFPQKGTSMDVDLMIGAEEYIVPIYKLSWDKQKFSIEETYSELNYKQ